MDCGPVWDGENGSPSSLEIARCRVARVRRVEGSGAKEGEGAKPDGGFTTESGAGNPMVCLTWETLPWVAQGS